jgi:hypothetical protein
MGDKPSETEIQRRIADLLRSPGAGHAVMGELKNQGADRAHRVAVGDLRADRAEASRQAAGAGLLTAPRRVLKPVH